MFGYVDPTVYAVPGFIVAIVIEFFVLARMKKRGARVVGYEKKDTWASLGLGIGSLLFVTAINVATFFFAKFLWQYRIADLGTGPLALFVAMVAWDFSYYWQHRIEHEVRLLWACHINHHSSKYFNFSTALRQPWTPWTHLIFYAPWALLGVRPELILFSEGLNLIYQFWVHTEMVDKIGPLEWILNTPSHHRVHHGSNPQYLDKNYGGVLIIWDRLFGSFEPEVEPVRYGLTHDLESFNPVVIAFHEYIDMVKQAARAKTLRQKLRTFFASPAALAAHPPD